MTPTLPFDPIAEGKRQWEKHWGPDAVSAMGAVTSIMRAQQILLGRLNGALRPFGLTFPRYEALMLLYYSRRGSLPLGKMGDRLQVHRASVTNVVDRLEEQGLVRRMQHERDRRAVLAEITVEGRRVAQAATAEVNSAQLSSSPLTPDELDQIFALLRALRIDEGDFDRDT
jgi:DNA-binding MarR family transcriptional regulator